MKKIIVAALAGLSMLSANAGGLVQVLDNEVDDVLIYVDLDSVKGTKNQVIGGDIGELYVSAIMRIDILENSPFKTVDNVHYMAQEWVISCSGDKSYYKLSTASYGGNHKFISSSRMGDDIILRSDFKPNSDANETDRAIALATNLACDQYLDNNPPPHFIKYQN